MQKKEYVGGTYIKQGAQNDCLSNISKNEEIFCTALLTANISEVNFLIS